MKRSTLALAAVLTLLPLSAFAHKAWLLPSQTVIAGDKPVITVDAAVSNDLFYFNHVPLQTAGLVITAPDGNKVEAQNLATGKYRTVFDVALDQQGTYKIAVVNAGLFANWIENGQPKRWRGDAKGFASGVPKDAQDLKVAQSVGRIETFVTHGAPSGGVFKTSGEGIELVPVTHPNDLVEGEEARFKLLVDGKPQAGLEIEIVRGGTRYRNAQDELKATTDGDGEFKVTWPQAGMYWLETGTTDARTSVPQARQRRLSYVATFEVLPQ